jgi:hypothetical protein
VSKQFFQQSFRFIDSVLFNVLLLRKDLCTSRRASEIHSNISRLEGWLAETAGDEWVGPLNNHLHYMRQVRAHAAPHTHTHRCTRTRIIAHAHATDDWRRRRPCVGVGPVADGRRQAKARVRRR